MTQSATGDAGGERARLAAILFDMDGVMVDTEPLYWAVARELARRYGKTVSDATLRRMMGRGRLESMRIFAADCGITSADPAQLLDEREALMVQRFSAGVDPMPGLNDMLARFHGRLKLAVVTSSPRKFTDVLLPSLEVDRFFDVVQTGDDVARGKPDPQIYLAAMERLGLAPPECVVLEDSLAGAQAGHRAGARLIAVPTELTAGEDFSFADARVTNLPEASGVVEAMIQQASPRST
ncbi:MAG TPA: HAD family phosphatase [Tepidisphaeraceae bacterium]|nr:HAD family phosphatase [Tepidisphaeraceae bacterium]